MRRGAWRRVILGALWCGGVALPRVLPAQPRPSRSTAPTPIRDASCTDTAGTARATAPRPLTWRDGPVPVATWRVQLGARRVPVTVVVADIDPQRIQLALEIARVGNAMGPWRIDQMPADAVIAFNAGQFGDDGPWGWVVHRGREWQAPGRGSLAAGIAMDSAGRVLVVAPDSIDVARQRGGWVEALQSYPQLLSQGRLPALLCRDGSIDRQHRDIRMALGVRRDGHVLVALSRYTPAAGVAGISDRLPVGPTTLEMAALMQQLGAQDAVMLDGGLSAQLRVRNGTADQRWPGLRAVPLAVVGRLR